MRISDWSSERVLFRSCRWRRSVTPSAPPRWVSEPRLSDDRKRCGDGAGMVARRRDLPDISAQLRRFERRWDRRPARHYRASRSCRATRRRRDLAVAFLRSEEHTSELQSLMRISYAVFCLKKKKQKNTLYNTTLIIT